MDNFESFVGPRLVDALRSERLFRTTFGQVPIGIGLGTMDGRILEANPAFCEAMGFSREELLQMHVRQLTMPEDWEVEKHHFADLVAGRADEFTMLKRNRHRRGHAIWVEVSVRVVRLENDEAYIVGVVRMVDGHMAARSELEELVRRRTSELREMRRERDAFFDLSPDFFLIGEVRHGVKYFRRVNPAMCRALGYTAQELCARPAIEFVHPDDRERTLAEGCMSGRSIPGVFFENRYVTKSGESLWMSWTSSSTGENDHFCIGRNVTRLKERLADETKQQRKMASACKLSALGLMAGNISHEIRNPLTIVYGNACRLQALLSDQTDARVKKMVSDIESMSQRIVKIVDGLRGFVREASRDPFTSVEVHKLLDDLLSFSRSGLTANKVEFEFNEPAEAISITCQPVQIQQVLLNLLNNAHEAALATREGRPRMGLRYRRHGDDVRISVFDNGPGVDPTLRANLFEPFFTTKKAGTGTGLGLNIARTIVESHRGRLYLDEGAPETTFVVQLPTGPTC